VIGSIDDELEFDASRGNTVFVNVKGTNKATYFGMHVFLLVDRITEWPQGEVQNVE
jgi:hypothetical protein